MTVDLNCEYFHGLTIYKSVTLLSVNVCDCDRRSVTPGKKGGFWVQIPGPKRVLGDTNGVVEQLSFPSHTASHITCCVVYKTEVISSASGS